jgi:hypothetical protein
VARTAALCWQQRKWKRRNNAFLVFKMLCPKLAGQLGVGWDRTLYGAFIDPCPLAERGRIVVQDLGMGSPARKF